MIFEKTFRKRLAMLIGDQTCENFERLTGVNEKLLQQFLNGDSLPSLKTLEKIALNCGVSLGWLIGEEQMPQSSGHKQDAIINASMLDIVQWISEQDSCINYWEILKGKLALEYPDFTEWLKNKK